MDINQTKNGIAANRKKLMVRHPDEVEEIDSSLLPPKLKLLPLVTCYDYDLAHDRLTRISIGGVVVMVDKTAIIHKPKSKPSIETSTYGAELNDGRVGIEYCKEIRHVCMSLGVESNMTTKCYGDNKYAYESCTNENLECKSRHSSTSLIGSSRNNCTV